MTVNESDNDVSVSLRRKLTLLRQRRDAVKYTNPDMREILDVVIDLVRAGLRNDLDTIGRILGEESDFEAGEL